MLGGRQAVAAVAIAFAAFAATTSKAQSTATQFDYAGLYRFQEPKPTIITQPSIVSRPSGEDAGRAYPPNALRQQINGRADLQCRVSRAGQLVDCRVGWEGPAGYGFGSAALALATRFVMRPQLRDGEPTDAGRIQIPFNFSGFPRSAPAPSPPPQPPPRAPYAPFGAGVPAPPELAGIEMPKGRLAALGATSGGTMWFLSLDDEARKGRSVALSIMQVFPVPRFPFGAFNVWRYSVDCAANQARWLGNRYFDEELQPDGWNLAADGVLPTSVTASTPVGRAALIACGAESAGRTVATAAQAMAVTRGLPTP